VNKLKFPVVVLGLLMALAALSLSGCFGEEYIGPPTPPPVVVDPVNPCADDATLCVPAAALRDTGEVVFQQCSGCHGPEGQGERGPRVANSDFVMNNRQGVINLILRGNQETMPLYPVLVVNGDSIWGGGMPAWHEFLTNHEIAGVLSYLRGVLNDSLVTNCDPNNRDDQGRPICTKTARTQTDMDKDTVAVWEVKAVRDSLIADSVIAF
jgi:mono/diheme cytochrome c family protein